MAFRAQWMSKHAATSSAMCAIAERAANTSTQKGRQLFFLLFFRCLTFAREKKKEVEKGLPDA
jgi:hypothetical protein